MTIGQNDLLLIGDIYDAAINPDAWSGILDRLAPAVGAVGATIQAAEALDHTWFGFQKASGIYPLHVLKEYAEKYAHYDVPAIVKSATSPAGTIVTDEDVWPEPGFFENRPDVVWLRNEINVFRRMAIRLNDERAWIDAVTYHYAGDRDGATELERRSALMFWPHIAKAVALGRGFHMLQTRYNAVLGALDRYRVGLFLVFPNGEVLERNRSAQEIVDRQQGIGIGPNSKLLLRSAEDLMQVQAAVREIGMTAAGEGAAESVLMRIDKADGGDPYLIEISPVRDSNGEIDSRFKGALISVIDPDNRDFVSTRGLQKLYELTDTEISVVELLVGGRSLPEIADIRGVSPETVKTQQKSIFRKTGAASRTDLIRLALTVNLPVEG